MNSRKCFMDNQKKTVVISGINLVNGGPLSVFKDLLDTLKTYSDFEFICFVHKKDLYKEYLDLNHFVFIELPLAKKNYLFRFFYEYVYFYFYSKKKHIYTWISMHDMTPSVKAKYRYVYCHNPTPFAKFGFSNIKYGWQYIMFNKFYKFIYKINIKKNYRVIVQQQWIKKRFISDLGVSKNQVIVAHPDVNNLNLPLHKLLISSKDSSKPNTFIFPSFPRFFKNFEVICKASQYLHDNLGEKRFKVILTLSEDLNKYSRDLYKKYNGLDYIKFVGILSRDRLFEYYEMSDCMIFPSYLETWGMPITEYKLTEKPMILADLPYAHETSNGYSKTMYFKYDDYMELAEKMLSIIQQRSIYVLEKPTTEDSDLYTSWDNLIDFILTQPM